jgi:hypothetical protein
VTQLFSLRENAIAKEPGVPLSRRRSGKGPGSLQPEQVGGSAVRAEPTTWPTGLIGETPKLLDLQGGDFESWPLFRG